jgi:hypothetical protein
MVSQVRIASVKYLFGFVPGTASLRAGSSPSSLLVLIAGIGASKF